MRKLYHYGLAVAEIVVKWGLALMAAIFCVTNPITQGIAVGFTAVTASMHVKNPYVKVIAATGGSILGMFLVFNFMEIAIALTAFQFKRLLDRYVFHLERQLDGEDIFTGALATEMAM